jgi:hypothetical protein
MFLRVQRELQNIVQAGGALDSVILDVKPLDIELPLFKKLFDKERTRSAANLIRKHKPDILVVANDQGINATFIKICRLLQIPTLALQDGVLIETKKGNFFRTLQWRDYLLWRLLSSISDSPVIARLLVFSGWRIRVLDWGLGGADKIAAMGDFYKRLFISRGVPSSRIIVTGYPLLDDVSEETSSFNKSVIYERLRLRSTQKLAVLVTQPFVEDGIWSSTVRERLVKTVTEAFKHLENVQLLIKLHPREDMCTYEKIVGNQMPIFKDVNLHELLLASDVVLTVSSTVGLWALAYKKPLIILNFLSSGHSTLYREVAVMVNDPKELPTIVRTAISNSNESKVKLFLLDHVSKLDGKASRRIAEQIIIMVSQTRGENLRANELEEKTVVPSILHETNGRFQRS